MEEKLQFSEAVMNYTTDNLYESIRN